MTRETVSARGGPRGLQARPALRPAPQTRPPRAPRRRVDRGPRVVLSGFRG